MRKVEISQMEFGEIHIEAKSRDDIPAVVKGIQHIYADLQKRRRIFAFLTEQVRSGINLKIGRPGMNLWRVLVHAVLKQRLGCDYDRLQEIANQCVFLRKL